MMPKKYSVFFLIIVILLVGCDIKEPVLPRWVVPFVIPIGNEDVIFKERLTSTEDSTIVSEGDSLFINISRKFSPESFEVQIPSKDSTTTVTIDTLHADSLDVLSTGFINILELYPFLSDSIGKVVYVPEATLSFSVKTLESSDFKKLKASQGIVQLSVHNRLPLTLGPNSTSPDGIEITIVNDSTGTVVSNVTISDPIPPGESGTGTSPLGNDSTWIYSPIRLEYHLPVANDTSFLVTQTLLDTSGYKMQMSLKNLIVDEIVGKVHRQTFNRTRKVAINSKNKIITGKISEGTLRLTINNHLPLSAVVYGTMPDLRAPDNQPLRQQFNISANSSTIDSVNLTDYTIENSVSPGSILDSLRLRLRIVTKKSDGFVHLKSSDEFISTLSIDSLTLESLEGILARDTLKIDPVEENDVVDYDGFGGGIAFQGAELLLGLNNPLEIENLFLNFKVTGYHKDESGLLTDSASIVLQNKQILPNDVTTILLSGPDVDNFLNILPTDITAEGNVDYAGHVVYQGGEQLKGRYNFTTPFKLKIQNAEPVKLDPDTLYESDIDKDVREAAGDDIRSAALRANVLNHSPLGGQVRIFVSADSTHQDIYDTTSINPDLEFYKTLRLSKAPVDPNTGYVTIPVQEELTFKLNTRELRVFKGPPIRVGFLLNLEDTDGYVVLRGSDYLRIAGEFEISILVKDE